MPTYIYDTSGNLIVSALTEGLGVPLGIRFPLRIRRRFRRGVQAL